MISPAWFLYFQRILMIPTDEFNSIPVGQFNDLVACHQIANGAKEKNLVSDDVEAIPMFLP